MSDTASKRFTDTRREHGIDTRLVPPGVRDERAEALIDIVARGIEDVPPDRHNLTDFDTVDARLLPTLVRQNSLQEFMFEGITEAVVRRFLKNRGPLHALKGTAAGIRFGLSLLGMRLRFDDWFEQEPMGAPNTYDAIVYVNEQIFDHEPDLLGEDNQRAARAMIDAMKRWSQEGDFELGLAFGHEAAAANAQAAFAIDRGRAFAAPDLERGSEIGAADAVAALSVERLTLSASPDKVRGSTLSAASACAAVQIDIRSFSA